MNEQNFDPLNSEIRLMRQQSIEFWNFNVGELYENKSFAFITRID